MRLAEERRQHRDDQQQQQPGQLDGQHRGQRDQGDQVLGRREQQRDQADPPHRLAARPLEVVVGLRVLVLGQIEGGGVLHQPHADSVGEQVAQQALEQRGEPRQSLAPDRDGELEHHQAAEMPPVHLSARGPRLHRGDHAVDDQLADPQHRQRDERPHRAQHEDARGVATVGLEHQLEEWRDVLERLEPFAPAGRLALAPREQALGTGHHPMRNEAGRGSQGVNFPCMRCVNITR